MIAKVPPKRRDGKTSFKDLTNYCLGITGHGEDSVLHIGLQNLYSPLTAPVEMEALATENTRCKDPAFHFILSWREMEAPTFEQVDEAVKIALKELDLEDCQALWALQADTQNLHAHVAANRVDPETGRAIQPAGNWTYKALERAARKIEVTQGWEVEQTGRYFVTPEGDIIEKRDAKREERLSQKARDIEAHTGTKSAERLAKEKTASILKNASSWTELHERLAAEGIAFERKGSGAILRVGEVLVKTSTVGRTCSFSKLLARLGAFQERSRDLITKDIAEVQPVEQVAEELKVKRSWKGYIQQRSEYFASKGKALKELQLRQKNERESLLKLQKREREALWKSASWQGRGAELNQQRSLLAARQLTVKLNLRDEQKRQSQELKKRFVPRFPSFKQWLQTQQEDELFMRYRYSGQTVLTGLAESKTPHSSDIRAFTAVASGRSIAYCRHPGRADFVDCGRRIVMKKDHDEAAVLAAMQLACQKWGSVQINGMDEKYRQLCVQVAIKHNLKISNPDLENAVAAGRERLKMQEESKAKKPQKPQELFARYSEAVGAERFRILVTDFQGGQGTKAFVFDRNSGGLEGKTAPELLKDIPRLETYARNKKNINVVPISRERHHILIDDLTAEKLEQLRTEGYRPSCVIESSPGNFQAVLTVLSLKDDTAKDKEQANRLTKTLNERYGDPKLAGAVHAHRLPPFKNFKPKHRREDGSYPTTRLVEAEGGTCAKALDDLKNIDKTMTQQKADVARKHTQALLETTADRGANDPNGAYWKHYKDVVRRFGGAMDYSRVDGMIGVRMRVTGYSLGQIQDAIERNAPEMRQKNMTVDEFRAKYQYRNWKLFAQETAEKFVFGPRGAVQFGKAETYRPYLMKLEGRDIAQERAEKWLKGRTDTKKKREGQER